MEPKTQNAIDKANVIKAGEIIWLGGSKEGNGRTWKWISDNSLVPMDRFWTNHFPRANSLNYNYLALSRPGKYADKEGTNDGIFFI